MASASAPSRSLSSTGQGAARPARTQRGVGFDLSGRQSRLRRDDKNARDAARSNAYRAASVGDMITAAMEKAGSASKTKNGKQKGSSVSFSAQSYAEGRPNDAPLDSRHNKRSARNSRKTSKPKPAQEYNALGDDFGPALGTSAPLATPAVSWGAHLNHRPKPAPKEPTPEPETRAEEPGPSSDESIEETKTQVPQQEETQNITESDTASPVGPSSSAVAWGNMIDSDDEEEDDAEIKRLTSGDSWADSI
jgi:hypothetical protein